MSRRPRLAGAADKLRTVEQLRAGLDVIQSPDYPSFLAAFVRPLFQVTPLPLPIARSPEI